MSTRQKLKYCCVGAGRNAQNKHIKNYAKVNDIELVAVCDINMELAKAVAKEYGFSAVYSDWRQMMDKQDIDFLSICTPNKFHADIAIEAMERGIHVHCEKPWL